MKTLRDFVEQISDDFESTFSVVSDNKLQNMLGFPGDFDRLSEVIRRYIPRAFLKFTKTNSFEGDYDIYVIELISGGHDE